MRQQLKVNDFTNPTIGLPRSARFLGGGGGPAVPDNSAAMMQMMRDQDARNAELSAAHQTRMAEMQMKQMDMEKANTIALQKEEEDLKRAQQQMENEAQGESLSQATADELDYDQVITGFYSSLAGERPE